MEEQYFEEQIYFLQSILKIKFRAILFIVAVIAVYFQQLELQIEFQSDFQQGGIRTRRYTKRRIIISKLDRRRRYEI